jgi:hypothetical protein
VNEGRKNQEAYAFFVKHYLVCAAGVRESNRLKHQESPGAIYTCGDEALTLWQLENSWDVWSNMKARSSTTKSADVQPKYTVSGDKGGSKKFGGWNAEGKKRYNILFEKVEAEHDGPLFLTFDAYYTSLCTAGTSKKRKKKASLEPSQMASPLQMRNTLSSLYANNSMENQGDKGAKIAKV